MTLGFELTIVSLGVNIGAKQKESSKRVFQLVLFNVLKQRMRSGFSFWNFAKG